MERLYILVCFLLVLICIVLTLFTSVVLYEFLTAAYDVVSGWIQNLKWKRRCASGRRNNHAETSKASTLRPVMHRVHPRVCVRHAVRREPDGARKCDALHLL